MDVKDWVVSPSPKPEIERVMNRDEAIGLLDALAQSGYPSTLNVVINSQGDPRYALAVSIQGLDLFGLNEVREIVEAVDGPSAAVNGEYLRIS